MAQNKIPIWENRKILPRAAVIQDMSGFGRVSLTESIPVMSAMGVEVCPLPTAILSTHTYEFENYTLLDTTDEMGRILNHWNEINLDFDGICTGYLGSKKQIEIIKDFILSKKTKGAFSVVDPVIGDNALLDVKTVYSDRTGELIDGMRELCKIADVITPNLTEACLLTGLAYPENSLSDAGIKDICKELKKLGTKSVVITSVMTSENSMCVAVYDKDKFFKIDCGFVPRAFHGTGDIFTSVLCGAMLNGHDVKDASVIATDFVARCIEETVKYPQIPIRHGVLFETVLKSGYFANPTPKVKAEEI